MLDAYAPHEQSGSEPAMTMQSMNQSETIEAEVESLLACARRSADTAQATQIAGLVIDIIDHHSISDVLVAMASVFAFTLKSIRHFDGVPDCQDQIVLTAFVRIVNEMSRNSMH